MTGQYLLLCLLLVWGCATTKRPDPELIEGDGVPLEAQYVAPKPSDADLEQFRSTAERKFGDLMKLSRVLMDSAYASEIRKATMQSWRSFWAPSKRQDPATEKEVIRQLAALDDGAVRVSAFQKVGGTYRANIASVDWQLEANLLQLQKAFGEEIHLVWDVRFVMPKQE